MSASTGLGGPRALCCAVLCCLPRRPLGAAEGGGAAFSRVSCRGGGDSLPLKAALVPLMLPVCGVGFDGLPDLLGGVQASLPCLSMAAFSGGGERACRGGLAAPAWLLVPGSGAGFLAGGGARRRPCCVAGGFLLLGVVVVVLGLQPGLGRGRGGSAVGGLLTVMHGFGGRARSGGDGDPAGGAGGLADLWGWGGGGGAAEGGSSTEPYRLIQVTWQALSSTCSRPVLVMRATYGPLLPVPLLLVLRHSTCAAPDS